MKKLVVFGSGGGTGFQKLVEASRTGMLHADIVAAVSNHSDGGMFERATRLKIPFIHFTKPNTAEQYQQIAKQTGADFFALSGWLLPVNGLDPGTNFNSATVFNIHPGPLPKFGGKGMYGDHVHKAVLAAFQRNELAHSAVTMHFVTENYDEGREIFKVDVPIKSDDTWETLKARVNQAEHHYQPLITNMVVNGMITPDGTDASLIHVSIDVPFEGYN